MGVGCCDGPVCRRAQDDAEALEESIDGFPLLGNTGTFFRMEQLAGDTVPLPSHPEVLRQTVCAMIGHSRYRV